MQIQQHYSQLIDELKMYDSTSLLQKISGTLIEKLCDKEQLKELVTMYQHKNKEFQQKDVVISYNCILIENQYIELSRCSYEVKMTKIKNSEGIYVIILQGYTGKEFIITNNQSQYMRIQIFLKRYCANKNFQGKYQLLEQKNCLPLSQTYKNNELFSTQIIEKKLLKDQKELQMFHNSITIMHSLQLSPNIIKIYEDQNKYYLIGQNMKLQSLESLLQNGFDFKEVPLVSIIFMILQTLQKYQNKGIYHGNINLQSVFLNFSSQTVQISILYPKYCENSNYQIENDIYNLGILLYQITFYSSRLKQFVDLNLIQTMQNQLADPNFKQFQFKFLYRISQLDLLKQLLSPGITLEKAIRHQWFVTIKQNLKMEQNNRTMHKFNLNTIVESTNELSMTSSQMDKKIFSIQDQEPGEEFYPIKYQVVNCVPMIPSKSKHDQAFLIKSKTFSSSQIKRGSIPEIIKQPTCK